MLVLRLTGGPIPTNGYLAADEESGTAAMVDPPHDMTGAVLQEMKRCALRLEWILNTHGHWDHVGGNASLKRKTGSILACHRLDSDLLRRPAAAGFPVDTEACPPDRLLEEGDGIVLGASVLTVVHTPGHTPGGICFYEPRSGILFSGDTLFEGAWGRTDFAGGDERQMLASLARLALLPPETRFYPGHGPESTIGEQSWLTRLERN